MKTIRLKKYVLSFLLFAASFGYAGTKEEMIQKIQDILPGSEIDLVSFSQEWKENGKIKNLRLSHLSQNQAFFVVDTSEQTGLPVKITFQAKMKVLIPQERILPNQVLKNDQFRTEVVDVSQGYWSEIRASFFQKIQDLESYQSKTTLSPGQPIAIHQLQKIPDIKKGDRVKVKMKSGTLTVGFSGIASEAGSRNESIRILSTVTTKTLIGKVIEPGLVEVEL